MTDYWVYCPFSGATSQGQDCYCGSCAGGAACNTGGYCTACGGAQCPHNPGINGLCCPIDIFGAANKAVKVHVSSNILSMRTTRVGPSDNGDPLCGTPPPANFAWVNEGVKVDLYCKYGAQGTLIGTVYYGHLRNRIPNGGYDNPYGRIVGYLGDRDCCTCPEPCVNPVPNNCKCDCYKGIHVHTERLATGGFTYHRDCGYPLTTTTPIYRFTSGAIC